MAGPVLAGVAFIAVMGPWWVTERASDARVCRDTLKLWRGALRVDAAIERRVSVGADAADVAGRPEFKLYVHMGEVRYSGMRKQQAIERIRENPKQFLRHAGDRFLFFWANIPHPPEKNPLQEMAAG